MRDLETVAPGIAAASSVKQWFCNGPDGGSGSAAAIAVSTARLGDYRRRGLVRCRASDKPCLKRKNLIFADSGDLLVIIVGESDLVGVL